MCVNAFAVIKRSNTFTDRNYIHFIDEERRRWRWLYKRRRRHHQYHHYNAAPIPLILLSYIPAGPPLPLLIVAEMEYGLWPLIANCFLFNSTHTISIHPPINPFRAHWTHDNIIIGWWVSLPWPMDGRYHLRQSPWGGDTSHEPTVVGTKPPSELRCTTRDEEWRDIDTEIGIIYNIIGSPIGDFISLLLVIYFLSRILILIRPPPWLVLYKRWYGFDFTTSSLCRWVWWCASHEKIIGIYIVRGGG